MDHHQRTTLVASAILSESTLLAVRYKTDEARNAMISITMGDALKAYKSTLKQRFEERVKGKGLLYRVWQAMRQSFWYVNQEDYARDLFCTACFLAMEEINSKTESDLERLAVELTAGEGTTLSAALSMVAKDMLQEAGL